MKNIANETKIVDLDFINKKTKNFIQSIKEWKLIVYLCKRVYEIKDNLGN